MKISLIGTGLMGHALGTRLLDKKIDLTVYNRTAEKTHALVQAGATAVSQAEDALKHSDITLLMLSDAAAIGHVLNDITPESFAGKLLIQMGTIAPDQSRKLAARITAMQGQYLECPVLGSLPEARSGNLILMAGGNKTDFNHALPLLKIIGKEIQLIGSVGQGATVKLAMNQLIAGLTATFSLSLALIEKEHIDIEQFMSIVRNSALYAPTFDKKLDRMRQRYYDNPNFPTKHLAKDTTLFLHVAKQLELDTRALEGIDALLKKAIAKGLADTDYSAIYDAIINNGTDTL